MAEELRLSETVNIVSAYLGRNTVSIADIPEVMSDVNTTLRNLDRKEPEPEPLKPAVPIKKSVTPDYLVCLEDGKKLKMLKRHLRTVYDLTPDEYRSKWGLPADYPMVAPNYAKQRSEFAKSIGLGKIATKKTKRAARKKTR